MVKELVRSKSLAPIMVCEKRLEPVPQVFRGQQNVMLVVPFTEYLEFLSDMPKSIGDYLLSNSLYNTLELNRRYREQGRDMFLKQKLLKAYYLDMAAAVAKEVYYAEYSLSVVGTYIVHRITNVATTLSARGVVEEASKCDYSKLLNNFLGVHGYSPIENVKHNVFLWKYSQVLVQSAMKNWEPWAINIKL